MKNIETIIKLKLLRSNKLQVLLKMKINFLNYLKNIWTWIDHLF